MVWKGINILSFYRLPATVPGALLPVIDRISVQQIFTPLSLRQCLSLTPWWWVWSHDLVWLMDSGWKWQVSRSKPSLRRHGIFPLGPLQCGGATRRREAPFRLGPSMSTHRVDPSPTHSLKQGRLAGPSHCTEWTVSPRINNGCCQLLGFGVVFQHCSARTK